MILMFSGLGASLEEYSKIIMEFFKQKPTNESVKSVLIRSKTCGTAPYVLQILMAHFKEQNEALLLQADVATSAADVERSLTLLDSPRLIVLGPVEETNHCMVSIEGHVVTEGESFLLVLATLFASFYNFNLQYQNEACCTLEFIQRCFIGINPERGSKAYQGKIHSKRTGKEVQKKQAALNPHVCTFHMCVS